MTMVLGVKWFIGVFVAGFALLLGSIFIADRQLEPPFAATDLDLISLPTGTEPIAEGLLLYNSDATGNHELYASVGGATQPVQLTSDPTYDSWRPRVSPDRTTVLFYRTPAGVYDRDGTQSSLWMMDASGSQLIQVLPAQAHGWLTQGSAEWAPSGQELVMVGSRPQGDQVWITSVDGRDIRNVASDPGGNSDPDWAPDGKRIIYTACPQPGCDPEEREIYVVLAGGGDRTQLTSNDQLESDPQFSPNGEFIVMRMQEQGPDEDGENAVFSVRVMPTNRSEQPRPIDGSVGATAGPRWLSDQTLVFELDGDVVTGALSGGATPAPFVQSAATNGYPSP